MKRPGKKHFLHFFREEKGVAAVEMAVMAPFILIVFFGVVEISNFILVNQRSEKMAHAIADVVTQADTITVAELKSILDASDEMMHPFPFGTEGHVIVTSVHRLPNESPKVAWRYEGGGTASAVSKFGQDGGISPLPAGFVLNERETVIIAEIFYKYKPILTHMFGSTDSQLYKFAFYKPRLGALDIIQSQ